jgi:hypothetical protein
MSSEEAISAADLFLFALFVLGGTDNFVDVEDVYLKAFELAPRRLSWRTKATLPDLKKCAKGLQQAEARMPNPLVKSGAYARRLSMAGQHWVQENRPRLSATLLAGRHVAEPTRRPSAQRLTRLRRSAVFHDWMSNSAPPPLKWAVADIFRCSPDSPTGVWRERLETLKSDAFAAEDRETRAFLETIEQAHPEWFTES